MAVKRRHNMIGPKTLEEWVRIYEERDSDTEYRLSPGERVVFDPLHGFFTYYFDAESREILIPKMCGNGRHWRPLIHRLVLQTRHLGVRGVLCCTKRNPEAYRRILGGKLVKMEQTYDFRTGRHTILWFIFITPEDTKERQSDEHTTDGGRGPADSSDAAAGLVGQRRRLEDS